MAESKEEDFKDDNIIRLESHIKKMRDMEIANWAHKSFKWDFNLGKGDYFRGPNGDIYQITDAKGDFKRIQNSGNVTIKEYVEFGDSFWCEDTLVYCAASGRMVNLAKSEQQSYVLFKIRKREMQKTAMEKERKSNKKKNKIIVHKKIIDCPFLIKEDV